MTFFFLQQIQGKPIIQQRILPSPVISIDMPHQHRHTSTNVPADETNNIIFSPWKAFGPYVDTIEVILHPDLEQILSNK